MRKRCLQVSAKQGRDGEARRTAVVTSALMNFMVIAESDVGTVTVRAHPLRAPPPTTPHGCDKASRRVHPPARVHSPLVDADSEVAAEALPVTVPLADSLGDSELVCVPLGLLLTDGLREDDRLGLGLGDGVLLGDSGMPTPATAGITSTERTSVPAALW